MRTLEIIGKKENIFPIVVRKNPIIAKEFQHDQQSRMKLENIHTLVTTISQLLTEADGITRTYSSPNAAKSDSNMLHMKAHKKNPQIHMEKIKGAKPMV